MIRKYLLKPLVCVLGLTLLSASFAPAEETPLLPEADASLGKISVPFAFYNESFGAAVGYVYSVAGYPQKQSVLLGSIMAGSKGSGLGFVMGRDLLIPGTKRLFYDPVASVGYFSDNRSYTDGNPDFLNERAGSHNSDEENYIEGDGWDNFFRVRFKYLLPIGAGREHVMANFSLSDGLLETEVGDSHSWNPFSSGKTYIELKPFYRSQEVAGDDVDSELKTNGADFGLYWENRDFAPTPSRGNSWRIMASRDFGWFDSDDSWTTVSSEYDHYIPLNFSDKLRQSVLAIDFWGSYSPTWNEVSPGVIENRPPVFAGSTLGGAWRLRGYPHNRFHDKAAIYYAAELRMIPHWNPFDRWPGLQKHIGVEWLQFVPFAEVGRVAPHWDWSELHDDMNWSAGLGVRAWAKGIVVRVDTAVSEEQVAVQMMVSQPFQF